jgi:hypothetical protein
LPDTYTDERRVIPLHHNFLLGIIIIYRLEKQQPAYYFFLTRRNAQEGDYRVVKIALESSSHS